MAPIITPDPGQPASLPDNGSRTTYGRISLVLGIVSWIIAILLFHLAINASGSVLVPFFAGALVTVVFGHLGLSKGQKQRWAAVTGLILGYLELLGVIFIFYVLSQCC